MATCEELWNNARHYFGDGWAWLPAFENQGFGGTTFISFSVAFNVAIAKWEQLRKALSDAENQFSELFEAKIAHYKAAAVFADEEYKARAESARTVCENKVQTIKDENKALWEKCRTGAWIGAVVGALFLFFQCSMGGFALLLYIIPARLWWNTCQCKKKIPEVIRITFEETIAVLQVEQAAKKLKAEQAISEALATMPQ